MPIEDSERLEEEERWIEEHGPIAGGLVPPPLVPDSEEERAVLMPEDFDDGTRDAMLDIHAGDDEA